MDFETFIRQYSEPQTALGRWSSFPFAGSQDEDDAVPAQRNDHLMTHAENTKRPGSTACSTTVRAVAQFV